MISIGEHLLKDQTNILIMVIFWLTFGYSPIAIIKAAAIVNAKNKDLEPKLSKYIIKAANEVINGK